MTASGTKVFSGIYKARCVAVTGSQITVYVPQVFGDTSITTSNVMDVYPKAGSFGYVAFEGGDPAFPIWVGSSAGPYYTSTDTEPIYTYERDATNEPLGHTDMTQSTVSFDNESRTFTISPASGFQFFEVWCVGVPYKKYSSDSVTIPDESGLYYIYYDAEGTLSYKTTYFTWDLEAPTSYIYWNSTTGKAEYFADERHGIVLDWQTHEYLHRTRGAAYANGFAASNYVLGGNGSLDTHAQLDIANGTFFDEDLQVDITHSDTPTEFTWEQTLQGPAQIPVVYRVGSEWRVDTPTDFPMKYSTTVMYNSVSGSTWSATAVDNNKYTAVFLVATNNLNYPVLAVMGQYTDSNLGDMQDYSWADMDLEGFPSVEFRPLYKLIIQALTSAANTPKASIIEIADLKIDLFAAASIPDYTPSMPTGTLTAYAGSSAPSGWLLCYGQAVSRSTYASLFDVIGTTYGSGDGSTTFNIPDLRGRAPVALDNMGGSDAGRLSVTNTLGGTGGEEKHLLIVSEMPSHTHLQDPHTHDQNSHNHSQYPHAHTFDGYPSGSEASGYGLSVSAAFLNRAFVTSSNQSGWVNSNTAVNIAATATNKNATAENQNTGGDTSHNNMQPYILTTYIIKT